MCAEHRRGGSARAFRYSESLTDEMVREAKSAIHSEIRTEGWNQQASRDAIRHYSWGLGDDNPLFCDVVYAHGTIYGSVIAPPTFLYTICDAAICPGLPGIQPIYGAAEWEFFRSVKVDEVITSRAVLVDVKELRGGRRAPRLLVQRGEVTYSDARGAPVAKVLSDTLRIPHAASDEGLRYAPRSEHNYAEEELLAVEAAVMAEVRRGADSRYWEDVQVGDRLPAVVKGPINQFTMTAYYAGCVGSPGYKSAEMAWKYRHWARESPEKLPNQYDATYFREYVSPSMGHQNEAVAREIGMPAAYNNGPQRVGWAGHLLTNWCGDEGSVRSLQFRLNEAEIFGDTIWVHGRVNALHEYSETGGRVDLDIWSTNQLGQETARGTATVELPRRTRRAHRPES
jgi:acyl dehydratase